MKSQIFKLCNLGRYYSTIAQRKKICVIGSGPAGFYTAEYLIKSKFAEVDIFEKLPVPFGLLRYGVAPDHQDVKVASSSFHKIAISDFCNFYGNVNVGKDVSISELLNAYHAVVLAYGAEKDKKLGIPGEDTKNVLSGRDFVSWYNGHPEFVNIDLNLDCDTAVVVGHGNVALDVARILLIDTDKLKVTDIAEHAFEKLKKSRLKRVLVTGRRGPIQVAFTTKEFRALTKLNFNCIVSPNDFEGVSDMIPNLPRPQKRLLELVYEVSQNQQHAQEKTLEFKFYRKPKIVIPNSSDQVEKFVFGINTLNPNSLDKLEVVDTGKEEVIDCGLILKSIGHQSVQIDPSVPFDEIKCIVPNINGKVVDRKGLYCSGWIKIGPKGVLRPTMSSSVDTVETLVRDIKNGELEAAPTMKREELFNLLKKRGVKYVTYKDWEKIDKLELERGQKNGKVREKLCCVDEMLKIAEVV